MVFFLACMLRDTQSGKYVFQSDNYFAGWFVCRWLSFLKPAKVNRQKPRAIFHSHLKSIARSCQGPSGKRFLIKGSGVKYELTNVYCVHFFTKLSAMESVLGPFFLIFFSWGFIFVNFKGNRNRVCDDMMNNCLIVNTFFMPTNWWNAKSGHWIWAIFDVFDFKSIGTIVIL